MGTGVWARSRGVGLGTRARGGGGGGGSDPENEVGVSCAGTRGSCACPWRFSLSLSRAFMANAVAVLSLLCLSLLLLLLFSTLLGGGEVFFLPKFEREETEATEEYEDEGDAPAVGPWEPPRRVEPPVSLDARRVELNAMEARPVCCGE